jgi:hypothetical protein
MVFEMRSRAVENAFLHLAEVLQVTRQIKGLCEIEDFAVYYYDKSHSSFISSNPSLEHNLASKDYLQYDHTFQLEQHTTDKFMWWSENFAVGKEELLTREKLSNFGYSAGCSITKQEDNVIFMYSFATKSIKPDIKKYYEANKNELLTIGDFVYLRLHTVLQDMYSDEVKQTKKGLLRLVVDNVF